VNWLDGVILAIIIWFAFAAFSAGFIRETITVVAAILGVVLAGLFYKNLADDMLVFIDSERTARSVAFLGIFGAAFIGGQLIAGVMKETASLLQLGIFDSLAGALFGLFKGLLVVQLLVIFFAAYPSLGLEDAMDDSAFTGIFSDTAPILLRVLPTEFDVVEDLF
jgi:membrane protein required for colicin V production